MMSGKKQVLEVWLQRVWVEQDVNAIEEMFVATGRARGLGAQTLFGPEDFKIFHHSLSSLLINFKFSIDHFIEQGDWISALVTMDADSSKDNQSINITGNIFGIIKDGQIQEAYNHFDFMGLFSQLGLLPSNCFEQGLSGCRVV